MSLVVYTLIDSLSLSLSLSLCVCVCVCTSLSLSVPVSLTPRCIDAECIVLAVSPTQRHYLLPEGDCSVIIEVLTRLQNANQQAEVLVNAGLGLFSGLKLHPFDVKSPAHRAFLLSVAAVLPDLDGMEVNDARWQRLGFQSSRPWTDLRATGLLGLFGLRYIAETSPKLMATASYAALTPEDMATQDREGQGRYSGKPRFRYPFSAAVISVMYRVVDLISTDKGRPLLRVLLRDTCRRYVQEGEAALGQTVAADGYNPAHHFIEWFNVLTQEETQTDSPESEAESEGDKEEEEMKRETEKEREKERVLELLEFFKTPSPCHPILRLVALMLQHLDTRLLKLPPAEVYISFTGTLNCLFLDTMGAATAKFMDNSGPCLSLDMLSRRLTQLADGTHTL
ncbi:hypothetical protein KIPB_001880 [Kipferlia bialata]|uniref:ELMO domain-containing protein n=1 Tax=Kipferlia bialata TaxID=797122 RepID=A0A9K3CSP5_9EUKA|nr:hypothetical protein KIPB_001880 [Kipferlia bialata]|eukprot:g1880.t1